MTNQPSPAKNWIKYPVMFALIFGLLLCLSIFLITFDPITTNTPPPVDTHVFFDSTSSTQVVDIEVIGLHEERATSQPVSTTVKGHNQVIDWYEQRPPTTAWYARFVMAFFIGIFVTLLLKVRKWNT